MNGPNDTSRGPARFVTHQELIATVTPLHTALLTTVSLLIKATSALQDPSLNDEVTKRGKEAFDKLDDILGILETSEANLAKLRSINESLKDE